MGFFSSWFGGRDDDDFLDDEEEEETGVETAHHRPEKGLRVLGTRTSTMAVTLAHPQSTKDVLRLQESLKRGNVLVVNLSGLSEDDQRSFYNFLCGATVHGEGDYRPIGNDVYVFTPKGCDIDQIEVVTDPVEDRGLDRDRLARSQRR